MKIKIGDYKWRPRHLPALKCLKERISSFLEEHTAAKRYQMDRQLENEAEKWFIESKFPKNSLKNTSKDSIVIEQDEIGFPFELLMVDGVFLGQRYNIYRKTPSKHYANRYFKICYQFEENDEAYHYYEYIEKTFPVELIEPVTGTISANVFHISGHFEKEEKEKILNLSLDNNVVLFFNSCCTYEYKNWAKGKQISHYVLSYFAIPLENPQRVEDFPYFFYQNLLEGKNISTAFLEARQKYIDDTGCLTPLLFTLFTPDPRAHIFDTPYARHHRHIEKQIKRANKEAAPPSSTSYCPGFPLFLFQCPNNKKETLQSILNTEGVAAPTIETKFYKKFLQGESRCFTGAVFSKKSPPWPPEAKNLWVYGQKGGIGKTTLLYQVFQLFKYKKFKGPFYISFKEELRNVDLKNFREHLYCYLKLENDQKKFPRNGKKYLILLDDIESNTFLYHHFDLLVDELTEIFGACRIVAASRNRCPVNDFWELVMDITPGDINAREIRAYYHIEDNIKLPDIPLLYKLFSRIRHRSLQPADMNKTRIFEEIILYYQYKVIEGKPLLVMPETFLRYLAILAYCQFETGGCAGHGVSKKQFIEALKLFRDRHKNDIDWWLFDKERRYYRDGESICGFLPGTNIIIDYNDILYFVHDSFYEFLLAYYFYWQGKDIDNDTIDQLVFGEVPDYMFELVKSGIYAGAHPADYLRLVFDRLFYTRDYLRIEAILARVENQEFIKTSDQLWYCLVKGCYFARNPGKHIDEIRSFQIVNEFTGPESLFDREKLEGTGGKALRETCFTLLNILFDNNLLEEFFRLAGFLENTFPTMEVFGLLSRGYLKINQLDKSLEYLKIKEREIQSSPGSEKHQIRLHAEKGLLFYYKYLETHDRDYFDKGILQLTKADEHYQKDKREEGNYLFTLREFLRYYLAGEKPGEFARVMERIHRISIDRHPKTDYIPFLQGMAAIRLEDDMDTGIDYLLEGAAGFYEGQHLFESAVVYLWAYHYCRDNERRVDCLMEAAHVFGELEEKRDKIKQYWRPFDEYLKATSHQWQKTTPLIKSFCGGAGGAVFSKSAPPSNPYDRVKGILDRVDEETLAFSHQFRDILEDIVLVS